MFFIQSPFLLLSSSCCSSASLVAVMEEWRPTMSKLVAVGWARGSSLKAEWPSLSKHQESAESFYFNQSQQILSM